MSVISGTRRAFKELVDGSIRVQIDIDPRFKKQFLETFGAIDMPVAIAPLVADFERIEQQESPKGGALCRLAAMWCKDEDFQEWLSSVYTKHTQDDAGSPFTEEDAAEWIRSLCGINSRSELDSNEIAAREFQFNVRVPFMNWMKRHGK